MFFSGDLSPGMFDYFERTPDMVCIADREGYFKEINASAVNKLKYSREELFSTPISHFIYTGDKDITHQRRQALLLGKPLQHFQNRYVTKDGDILWLEWTSVYLPDREVVFAVARDISEKKKLELATEEKCKQLRDLTLHFKTSLEQRMKSVAEELHDEIAQLVSVVKLDIDWITVNDPRLDEISKRRMHHALDVAETLINAMRRLSFSIRPHMLDDFGLNETISLYCEELSLLSGIACSLESSYTESELTPEMRVDLFRICQELLANIIRHANAHKAKVIIKSIKEQIVLSVIDDGKGFDPDTTVMGKGLIHIKSRVTSFNGQLVINSRAGAGTNISVIAPRH